MSFNEDHKLETYKSLLTFGAAGLQSLQLLNGGAVVALLAYLGQVPDHPELAKRTFVPLVLFVLGLVVGTLAYIPAYRTQFVLLNESVQGSRYKATSHMVWLCVTFLVALASLAFFAGGAILGARALSHACG